MGYNTKQSRLIENILMKNKDRHMTADEIFDMLRSTDEPVGKTTVYRHLEKLCADGAIRKFMGGEGDSACFQYSGDNKGCKAHYHLKCTKCGKLIHAECDFLNELSKHIFEEHGFSVDGSRTVLYGICDECLKKKGNSNK